MELKNYLTPEIEKKLYQILQRDFPLVSRPFLHIAKTLGLEEEEVLQILQNWQKEGKLRQISAIFNPSYFQHRSSLFAFKVSKDKLDLAISVINAHPGVSHNYLRNHDYNLWFTLVVPPDVDLLKEAEELFQKSEALDFLYLPILKVFKIAVIFDEDRNFSEQELFDGDSWLSFSFNEKDKLLVKTLQEPLPLVSQPFKGIAESLEMSEDEIFDWLKSMKKRGALRRFAGLFKHHKMGYRKNIMVAWLVPQERIEEIAKKLVSYSFITHCYLRKSYPHFPYNLYTMCHFKEDEGLEVIQNIAEKLKITQYLPLETLKELKKIRLKLFYAKN
ncbi:MAG: Lrp/AsnC family transcriptional regulator [Caldimicrobium sp.]